VPDTLQEEARRCPACNEPGILLNKRPAPRSAGMPQGTTVEMYECRNDRCPDYMPPMLAGTSTMVPGQRYRWAVQINPDGSIPPKGTGGSGPKSFSMPGATTMAAQRARDNLAMLAAQDEGNAGLAAEIAHDTRY